MNRSQQEDWKFEVISQILLALAKNEGLKDALIFKGALILNEYLPTKRKSLDIDSNLTDEFLSRFPTQKTRESYLKEQFERAISRHFEAQNPVRYELLSLKISPNPKAAHPRGWDGFLITVSLRDHGNEGVRGLPKLTIDLAAPESLSEQSVAEIDYNGVTIRAYSLERVTGEKARAYLSTLRTYCAKMKRPRDAVRVKDLYDLTQIHRKKPMSGTAFWNTAGSEFRLACKSRFVDCSAAASFMEGWEETKAAYEKSAVIPGDISFEDVTRSIMAISSYWQQTGIIPFAFPLTKS
ncbi:MAG: nucleotidyl transferase AbiEii/AbiGii toxin family protein [Candidatus Aminicenantales bacterium]